MVLDRDEVPSEPEVARLMRQILDGLHYLHTINVAHLDIKVRTIKKINHESNKTTKSGTFSSNNTTSRYPRLPFSPYNYYNLPLYSCR